MAYITFGVAALWVWGAAGLGAGFSHLASRNVRVRAEEPEF